MAWGTCPRGLQFPKKAKGETNCHNCWAYIKIYNYAVHVPSIGDVAPYIELILTIQLSILDVHALRFNDHFIEGKLKHCYLVLLFWSDVDV